MAYQYSFWSEFITRNGHQGDLIISSLQKYIRRNNVEEAAACAYELYISSPLALEKMWRRLLSISVEDVGFANIDMAEKIQNLYTMSKNFPYDDGDQSMFFIHAIRLLAESPKDRSSDYLKNIIIKGFEMGEVGAKVIDVAKDKHTKTGIEMGRDSFHFFHEGAKVENGIDVDNDYKERYLEVLTRYYAEDQSSVKKVDNPFKFNATQY